MVTFRVAKVTVQSDHKLRVAKVTAQGAGTNPKLRVANAVARGAVPLSIAPIPDVTVEAYAPVTITVPGTSQFPPAATFSWRQLSGPAVSYSDNGTSLLFTSPTAMRGTTVVFGVTAQVGAQSSTEVTATVNVIPHLFWDAGSSGWTPISRKTAV